MSNDEVGSKEPNGQLWKGSAREDFWAKIGI